MLRKPASWFRCSARGRSIERCTSLIRPTSDVAGLHQAFVRGVRARGGIIEPARRVTGLLVDGDGWRVETDRGPILADLVVNAAGAWGDVVADLAGIRPVGLQPRRRTAFMVTAPPGGDPDEPLAAEMTHQWYIKRDGSQYLCSPADQTPSEPCDAKPEEVDVATAIERINAATHLGIRSVRSAWAGLRTFSPDETMVLGPDPERPSFIWCVGQVARDPDRTGHRAPRRRPGPRWQAQVCPRDSRGGCGRLHPVPLQALTEGYHLVELAGASLSQPLRDRRRSRRHRGRCRLGVPRRRREAQRRSHRACHVV